MNNLSHTLFLSKPELQKKIWMVFRRIHGDLCLEPEIKRILTESLMSFAHSQKTEQTQH